MMAKASGDLALPDWLPEAARFYLEHTAAGVSLRNLARRAGCHPSTVLRHVRRFETRRDDPLIDAALDALTRDPDIHARGANPMTAPFRPDLSTSSGPDSPRRIDEATLAREARRILRRLIEPGALLVLGAEFERAVVLRDGPGGEKIRTGVLDRGVAQAFALKDWIACRGGGRVAQYAITAAGRAALRRLIEADAAAQPEAAPGGLAEAPSAFATQHGEWQPRLVEDPEEGGTRRMRCNLAESPVAVLGRRREKDGRPFLAPDLVAAAERLRQDFELAQMGPRVAQNWDRFLTGGDRGGCGSGPGTADGPRAARDRVAAALRDLGPGLGDMALRCCCYLEGLETAERRLGWSARSGKIVLRIALMRLKRHYEETYGGASPLIG
ncbi:MAG: DUF6456 domain-containing protein [Gemmobacter sp.]